MSSIRDLGGLGGSRGSTIRERLYRSARPDDFGQDDWSLLRRVGVRTLVDLRNADEISELPLQPPSIASLTRPIEDQSDTHFMAVFGSLLGSPHYYAECLRRWPGLVVAAVGAVARAPDGGVVVHCAAGRDRTGLIVALILELAGVDRALVLNDYEVSARAANHRLRTQPNRHEDALSDRDLDQSIRAARDSLDNLLSDLDVEGYLLASGLPAADIRLLRRRLLEA